MTTLDHFAPGFAADPYAVWDALASEGPVWRWAELDSFVIVDHGLAREVLRDGDTFTLSRHAWEHAAPATDATRRPQVEAVFDHGIFQAGPADHARLRKLAVPTFSPAAIRRHRPMIDALLEELTSTWRVGDEVDLAADLANVLPVRVISRLLGIDPSREEWFSTLATDVVALADPTAGDAAMDRAEEQLVHFRQLLEDADGNGLYQELLAVQEDDDRLSAGESFALIVALMTAGMETTASAISLGMSALMASRDQLELLRSEPERWPDAVIELLRYSYIGFGLTRFPTRPVTLGGHEIRTGQLIWVNLGAALHDPAVFPEPGTLDVTRNVADAMPFGLGAHFCLGAALAKAEIECALSSLVDRFPAMAPVGPMIWRPHMLLRGVNSFPVRL